MFMTSSQVGLNEVFSLSQDPELAEQGGLHAQKGFDFQRFWAIIRVFELKAKGASDFLILFESVQDVVELDSEFSPRSIEIYQVKKKDGGEWSFNELTGLHKPDARKKSIAPTLKAISGSPVGKLYKAALAFKQLDSKIHFVSNAGCALPLATSGDASSKLECVATDLDTAHTKALSEALALLHSDGVPDLSKLCLRRTTLHPDEPVKFAIGAAVEYLSSKPDMREHLGQAKSLVEALFMELSKLTRQTQPLKSFADLRKQRGFSMSDMDKALASLKTVPDLHLNFDAMLQDLVGEGLPLARKLRIKIGAVRYFSALVSNSLTHEETQLCEDCATLAAQLYMQSPLLPSLNSAVNILAGSFTTFKDTDIFAYLLIQVTKYASTEL
jgi:hypothetical protein